MIDWLRRTSPEPEIALSGQNYPIIIARRGNVRRMVMRVAPDGSHVKMTVPSYCPTAEAVAFAHERADWLERQLAGIPQRSAIKSGTILPFRGREIVLEWRSTIPRRPVLEGSDAAIANHPNEAGPNDKGPNDTGDAPLRLICGGEESALPRRAETWLRQQAEQVLADDLAHYYSKLSALNSAAPPSPPTIALSRAKRRWGSCSSAGVVRINWRLIMASDAVRRSVVAHETAHLVHFNHSPAFYTLLRELYEDDLKSADRWLKSHGRSLYSYFG